MGEGQAHADCADGRGGAQHAKPHGVNVKNVLGDRGQEVNRAAEQYGKEVESDGGEDDSLAKDKMQAGEK